MGEDRVGFERPGREGGDETRWLEWIFFFFWFVFVFELVSGGGFGGDGEGGEVGGDEAERGVDGSEVEEVVGLGVAFLYYAAAGGALGYGSSAGRGGATNLRR